MAEINALAREPMTEEEKRAYIRASLSGHKNTHPYYRHCVYRYNAWKAKRIVNALPHNGKRLLDFVHRAGVVLRDYKVVQFANVIRRLKPNVIYEFGAGGSTALFAELMMENFRKYGAGGELHTFEQSKDYYDAIMNALPVEWRPYVFVHRCEVEYKRVSGFRLLSYNKPRLKHRVIDFVYIDGPDHIYDGIHYRHHKFFNGDIIDLANDGIEIRYAVNDGRWFNLQVYEELLPSFKCKQLSCYKSFAIIPK